MLRLTEILQEAVEQEWRMSAKKELVQTLAKSGVSPEQTPCMNAAAISDQLAGGAHQTPTAEAGTGKSAHPEPSDAPQNSKAGMSVLLEAGAERECEPGTSRSTTDIGDQQPAGDGSSIISGRDTGLQEISKWLSKLSADMPNQHVRGVTGREVRPGGDPQLVLAVPVPLQQREQANAQEVPVEWADLRPTVSEAEQVQA